MIHAKTFRWRYLLLSLFFSLTMLGGILASNRPALADITVNLTYYYKVKVVATFSKGQTVPSQDVINLTGGTSINAAKVSTKGSTVTYETSEQSDTGAGNVPPPQIQATSSMTGKSVTVIGGNTNKANPAIFTINGPVTNTNPTGGGASTATQPSCETVGGGPLDWLICGAFDTLSNVSNAIFNHLIIPLLRQPPVPISDTGNNKAIFEIWSEFRLYADIFLVIALVVLVIMQAVSGGGMEAYTAKKALPRLLLTVILINTSIYIVALMVDVTNVLGAGIAQIVTAPIASSGNLALKPSLSGGALFTGGTLITGTAIFAALYGGFGGIFLAAIPFIALNVILPLIIGFIIAFAVLALRQAIIIMLVIVSPIAFAMWFLPNTEGGTKRWWGIFLPTLMVYPGAVLIFTVFNVVAVIFGGTGGIFGAIGPVIAVVIEGVSLFGFLFIFRFGGSAVSTIHDTLKGHGNRLKEGIKGNPNDPLSARNRVKRSMNASVRDAADVRASALGGSNSRFSRYMGRKIGGAKMAERQGLRNIEEQERIGKIWSSSNDTVVKASTLYHSMGRLRGTNRFRAAGTAGNAQDQFQAADGTWLNQSDIVQGHQEYGRNGASMQTNYQKLLDKTRMLDVGSQNNVLRDYTDWANGENLDAGTATGRWQGISIPLQDMRMDMRRAQFNGDRGNVGVGIDPANNRVTTVNRQALMTQFAGSAMHSLVTEEPGTFETLRDSIAETYNPVAMAARTPQQQAAMEDTAGRAFHNLHQYVNGVPAPALAGAPAVGGPGTYATSSSAAAKNRNAAQQAYDDLVAAGVTPPLPRDIT